jgi:carbamoyl-phosphate synthase/aspartate carbamoyltransferase/dihydroorotase
LWLYFFICKENIVIRLPGLIDPHVHIREPGGTHKEDWDTGTAAALAGGFTMILAMPNTQPPITDKETFNLAINAATSKAHCDYAQFLGAGPDNMDAIPNLAPKTAGLKMYLDQTYGSLRLDSLELWMGHFKRWPKELPIVAHAESRTMAAVILLAAIYDRPIHIAHVSLREEIMLIKAAKEKGIKVTCEVTPHHLFLTNTDIPTIGSGRSEVRPRLASSIDQQALWENLDVIDCFATDHAPHTLQEKDSESPPPGFPGLETALPLLLTAVDNGKLSLDDLVNKMYTKPAEIFNLPSQRETWIEIDPEETWEIHGAQFLSKCGWTPFEGRKVHGRIKQVIFRGKKAFDEGRVLTPPGFGENIRKPPG